MFLKTEIEKLRNSLFSNCSEKEKLFYHFVSQEPSTESIRIPVGDLDKICFAIYTNSNIDISKEIQRIAPTEPFKHIHYSNSIVTLIPLCLKSDEAKKKYLKSYFDTHSLTEKFLLSRIFPLENFQFVSDPKTSLEKLIDKTFFHPDFLEAEKHLPFAFMEIADLIEFLAFRTTYLELLKLHPNTKTEKHFLELSSQVEILISVVTKRINITMDTLTFLIILIVSPLAVYIINQHYEELKVERLSSIWTFISPIIATSFFFIKKYFPGVFSFYDDFKLRLVKFWFSFRKLDYDKLSYLCKRTWIKQ